MKIRHVLSFTSLHIGKKDTEDFTLAIGYYASVMQTISFVSGYEQDSYTMVDQKITDSTFNLTPGVGCLDSLSFGTKAILASGGFDHRIKICSMKTLKNLITLKFHQNIVNKIILEKIDDHSVKLFSCGEDGYVCCWTL
jgi:WD40 repeat protein